MRLLLLGLLLGAGAFGQKIQVESDPAVDFAQFKTFTIRPGRLNSKNAALNSELVRKRIDFDIQKDLTAHKLTYVPSGPADLNVTYTLGSARGVQREAYPAGWRGMGTRVVRVPFTEGTLVIDLRDPRTRSLVFRAIATEAKSDAAKLENKLDDMVKKSLDKYPPKAR